MTLQLPGRTAHGVTTRLVGSCPTFSPLPRLNEAVIFFCVTPAVADTLHINKRDALCCPDFPHTPRGSKRQTVQLLSVYKISARRAKYQIYLNISEPQPNFKLRCRLKIVQAERKSKLVLHFSADAESLGRRPQGLKSMIASLTCSFPPSHLGKIQAA